MGEAAPEPKRQKVALAPPPAVQVLEFEEPEPNRPHAVFAKPLTREEEFDRWLATQPIPHSEEAAEALSKAADIQEGSPVCGDGDGDGAGMADAEGGEGASATTDENAGSPAAGDSSSSGEAANRQQDYHDAMTHLREAASEMHKLKAVLDKLDKGELQRVRLDLPEIEPAPPTAVERHHAAALRLHAKEETLRDAGARLRERASALRRGVSAGQRYYRELAQLNQAWRVRDTRDDAVVNARDVIVKPQDAWREAGQRHYVQCGGGCGGSGLTVRLRRQESGAVGVVAAAESSAFSGCRLGIGDGVVAGTESSPTAATAASGPAYRRPELLAACRHGDEPHGTAGGGKTEGGAGEVKEEAQLHTSLVAQRAWAAAEVARSVRASHLQLRQAQRSHCHHGLALGMVKEARARSDNALSSALATEAAAMAAATARAANDGSERSQQQRATSTRIHSEEWWRFPHEHVKARLLHATELELEYTPGRALRLRLHQQRAEAGGVVEVKKQEEQEEAVEGADAAKSASDGLPATSSTPAALPRRQGVEEGEALELVATESVYEQLARKQAIDGQHAAAAAAQDPMAAIEAEIQAGSSGGRNATTTTTTTAGAAAVSEKSTLAGAVLSRVIGAARVRTTRAYALQVLENVVADPALVGLTTSPRTSGRGSGGKGRACARVEYGGRLCSAGGIRLCLPDGDIVITLLPHTPCYSGGKGGGGSSGRAGAEAAAMHVRVVGLRTHESGAAAAAVCGAPVLHVSELGAYVRAEMLLRRGTLTDDP